RFQPPGLARRAKTPADTGPPPRARGGASGPKRTKNKGIRRKAGRAGPNPGSAAANNSGKPPAAAGISVRVWPDLPDATGYSPAVANRGRGSARPRSRRTIGTGTEASCAGPGQLLRPGGRHVVVD